MRRARPEWTARPCVIGSFATTSTALTAWHRAIAIWRLLTDRVLPLDYAAGAAALDAELSSLEQRLAGRFDLSRLTVRVARMREQTAAVNTSVLQLRDDATAGAD
jgi:hypothetical protein